MAMTPAERAIEGEQNKPPQKASLGLVDHLSLKTIGAQWAQVKLFTSPLTPKRI